jgi:hypothetical protein
MSCEILRSLIMLFALCAVIIIVVGTATTICTQLLIDAYALVHVVFEWTVW